MIMPSSKICTNYVRESFKDSLQIIIPSKRINFIKHESGEAVEGWEMKGCSFDCFYYCYNIGLPRGVAAWSAWECRVGLQRSVHGVEAWV